MNDMNTTWWLWVGAAVAGVAVVVAIALVRIVILLIWAIQGVESLEMGDPSCEDGCQCLCSGCRKDECCLVPMKETEV